MLKLDGKPFDPAAPTGIIKLVIEYLNKCPHDEVWTAERLCGAIGAAKHTLAVNAADPKLSAYRHGRRGTTTVWGHPKAIAEYKKLTGAK